MEKAKKRLILSSIFMILYLVLNLAYVVYKNELISKDMTDNISNLLFYVMSIIGIIYFFVLAFKKNIDFNKHYKGILFWSIIFFIYNIISGVIGFMLYTDLDKNTNKKKKRELPIIEYKEYTNKYICLFAFLICMFIMFFLSNYINGVIQMILMYVVIITIMVLVFRKQLAHDFKLFREYFREYISLTFKTWLKSLVVMMILSITIQIITNTTNSNNQQNLQDMFNVAPIIIALLTMIYAPIAEELMFRGVFRKFISNEKLFIIISGVVFGLMHVIDDSKTLAEFSYVIIYSVLGCYLASLYYKTNNIFTNISFHFMQNTLGVIGMLLLKFMG
ncbi:MAG: CPBP family intramembrane metalloprotease [Bacilli bacterium]|nr:CPBP family intramembrane metalloprotease [Bacilli bacterium]